MSGRWEAGQSSLLIFGRAGGGWREKDGGGKAKLVGRGGGGGSVAGRVYFAWLLSEKSRFLAR